MQMLLVPVGLRIAALFLCFTVHTEQQSGTGQGQTGLRRLAGTPVKGPLLPLVEQIVEVELAAVVAVLLEAVLAAAASTVGHREAGPAALAGRACLRLAKMKEVSNYSDDLYFILQMIAHLILREVAKDIHGSAPDI